MPRPMIVDISIANDGRQVYQVQDEEPVSSSKRLFDEMESTFSYSSSSSDVLPKAKYDRKSEDESEVWGPDVEAAFEEALRIIPKNGLSKIKVSGRSCGRNELISDFIFQKTGKQRTRKQVLSHIQVIKNLKKNLPIIDLINNGPSDPDSLKKFESVFLRITFQKSMGGGELKKRRAAYAKSVCEIVLNGFLMNCDGHSLSSLKSHEFDTNLKLKPNVNVELRFPGLFELFSASSIPLLHGMCKVHLGGGETAEGLYDTHLDLQLKGLSVNELGWSVLTVIYLFGQEVVRLIDHADVESSEVLGGVKNVGLRLKFAPEFWGPFFASLDKTQAEDDKHKDVAIRAVTMKQIVFRTGPEQTGPANILKKDIRLIVLWEFLRVNEPAKALTTMRRIHLIGQRPEFDDLRSTVSAPLPPTPVTPGYNLAAPVAVNPISQPLFVPNYDSYGFQTPFTPLTTPFTPLATPFTPLTTPVHGLVGSLHQQEELINRMESPIDLLEESQFDLNFNAYTAEQREFGQFDFDKSGSSVSFNLDFSAVGENTQSLSYDFGFDVKEGLIW